MSIFWLMARDGGEEVEEEVDAATDEGFFAMGKHGLAHFGNVVGVSD